jgi:hypothetical protein
VIWGYVRPVPMIATLATRKETASLATIQLTTENLILLL